MAPLMTDPTRRLETFTINLPGRKLTGESYSTPNRRTGRRIVVRAENGVILFDTRDCYDLGNARNSLENWVVSQLTPCAHCGQKDGGFSDGAQDQVSGHPICDRCVSRVNENQQSQPAEVSAAEEIAASISGVDLEEMAVYFADAKPALVAAEDEGECPF